MEIETQAGHTSVGEGTVATKPQLRGSNKASERHPKPMLSVERQIAHMKSKGITFDLVSEVEAASYLAHVNNQGILSFFSFNWRLVDIWAPKQA